MLRMYSGYQPYYCEVPMACHVSFARRMALRIRRFFLRRNILRRELPAHGRIEPGLPIETIGTGYRAPVYPMSPIPTLSRRAGYAASEQVPTPLVGLRPTSLGGNKYAK